MRLVSGGLREKVLPAWVVCFLAVIIFSLLAPNGLKWAFFAVRGEFCTGLALRRGLPGEFCTGLASHAVCPESFVPGRVRCVASGGWSAGKSSPCSGCLCLPRDNFLPARVKRAEMGVFRRAGRVLYRFGLEAWVAGRVLYRGVCAAWLVGGGRREKVLPASVVCVWTGIIFSLLAPNGLKWAFFAVWGEFCTGLALKRGLPGEFCTGGRLYGGLRVSNGKFQCQ